MRQIRQEHDFYPQQSNPGIVSHAGTGKKFTFTGTKQIIAGCLILLLLAKHF